MITKLLESEKVGLNDEASSDDATGYPVASYKWLENASTTKMITKILESEK